MKVLAAILVVVVGALVWAVFSLRDARREMAAQQQSNEVVILDFSNRWAATRLTLDEQKKVNETLESSLNERARQLDGLRGNVANLSTDLAKSRAETETARAETKTAQEEIAKRDQQINTLENRNVDLTKQMGTLQTDIAGLERQINETERKLAASEGNRQDLLRELKRLQDEKIGMEKQLNDLAFLRDQVRKLKEELTIARRLDWIRRGLYSTTPKKGAEALTTLRSTPREPASAPAATTPGLDVELRRSGEVKVAPATNAPARPQ